MNGRRDKVITCQLCHQSFVWTEEEQDFFQKKSWSPPKRCPVCRATYKAATKDKFRGKWQ